MLGVLAAISILASEMARTMAWPLALAALAHGDGCARRARRRALRQLAWAAGRAPELDGQCLTDVEVQWRGPLAFLRGRDAQGAVVRLAWWPDTLPAGARRELRLVASVPADPASTRSMAP